MKQYLKTALFLPCAILCAACSLTGIEEGNGDEMPALTDATVSLTLAEGTSETKTSCSASNITRSIIANLSEETGMKGLILEEAVSDMENHGISTKGTPVFTDNFADVYASGFKAAAVYDFTTKQPLAALSQAVFTQRPETDIWEHAYEGVNMPEKAIFFFNAPSTLPAYINTPNYDAEDESVTFSLIPASYPKTAVGQQDILFTCEDITTNKVNKIVFYHAFAAVKFKQGNADGGVTIKKIEISNQLTSGTCTITPVDGGKSSAISDWSQSDKAYATFSQTYDSIISYDEADGYFGSGFYKDATDENNLSISGDSKATTTFMCVPQSFSESDAKHVIATITYEYHGETKTVDVDFSKSLKGKSWEPGKLYTYSFKITELDVEVEDEVDGDTKHDVVITNTGNMPGYIRAAIVANWQTKIDESDVIVKSCDYTSEGTLIGLGSNWIKGADGYYYYKYGVNGGEATNQALFTSYKAAAAPMDGAVLQMNILAQIVADRKEWNGCPSGLSNDIED